MFRLSRYYFLTCCSLKEIQNLHKFIVDDEFAEVSLVWNSALKFGRRNLVFVCALCEQEARAGEALE